MIPLRDVIPSRTTPYVTLSLIGVNALVFARQWLFLGDEPGLVAYFYRWGLVPAAFSWTAVVTSMFVHAGLLHASGNLLSLWIFGDNVEDRLGHLRFLAFYLATGVAATLAESWADPGSTLPLVGASGAIAGVMGAYLVLFPRSRILVFVPIFILSWEIIEMPALFFLGLWFALQMLGGLARPLDGSGGIAFWAHAGGFLAGLALVYLVRRRERMRVEWWHA